MNTKGAFAGMGRKQRAIVSKMVNEEYYIVSTIDHRDNSTVITLMDDFGNEECDLTDKELTALVKRGFFLGKDDTMCLELDQMKFWINEAFAEEAKKACDEWKA